MRRKDINEWTTPAELDSWREEQDERRIKKECGCDE